MTTIFRGDRRRAMPILVLGLLALSGCVSEKTGAERAAIRAELAAILLPDPEAAEPAGLEQGVRLDLLLATARARNPALRESMLQALAALERVDQAAAWEDRILKLAIEDGSLRSPFDLGRADMVMVGFVQMIPALGSVDARTEAAVTETRRALEEFRAREIEIFRDVRTAYAEYHRAARTREAQAGQENLAKEILRITEVKYRAGTVPQADVLRAEIEMERVRIEIAENERVRAASGARINRLLHRAAEAPLGPPAVKDPVFESWDPQKLLTDGLVRRPDLRAGRLAVEAARAEGRLAGIEARLPEIEVEAMAGAASGKRAAYDASIGIGLPWLSRKRAARAREARINLSAAEAAYLTLADEAVDEVLSAHAEIEAARKTVEGYRTIVAKARQAVELTRSRYERDAAGFLDLLDSEQRLIEAETEYYRALGRHEAAEADLRRAAALPETGRSPEGHADPKPPIK